MPKRTTPAPEAGVKAEVTIDLSQFAGTETVAYYDTKKHLWKKGQLEAVPVPEGRQIKIKVGGTEIKAGPVLKKLEVPQGEVELKGKKYKAEGGADDLTVGAEGEILCNLVSADGQKLEHIDVEMIKNIQRVEAVEAEADKKLAEIKKEIARVSSIKKKGLMDRFTVLQKKLESVVGALGAQEEWGELEETQVKNISAEITKVGKELADGLAELSKEVSRITGTAVGAEAGLPEIAGELLERRDREMKNSPLVRQYETGKKDWEDKNKKKEVWGKRKKIWDKLGAEWTAFLAGNPDEAAKKAWLKGKKIKNEPKNPGAEPADAGPEPKKPAGPDILYGMYRELQAKLAANALAPGFADLLKEVKERSDKKVKNSGLGPDIEHVEPDKQDQLAEIVGQAMAEVLEGHKKQKETGKPETAFDFKKEKAELDAKIAALATEAQSINAEALVKKCAALKERIGGLKERAGAEDAMVKIWEDISELEMEIFTEKRKTPAAEKAKEKEIDIPDSVLAEMLKNNPKEAAKAMRAIYEDEIGGVPGGGKRVIETMMEIFGAKPDKAVLEKLQECGIRGWDQFKKIWDNKYAARSARILHVWAQDDLRGDVARRTSTWDRMKAIKWQLAGRIAANVALVGGGAIAATALFASGGLAGIGLAAAGGAAGGGVRAALQKFLFGRRGFEERKQKQLEALAERKKQEAIAELMQKRFGANADKFEAGTEQMFAALVAEAIREVNAETGKKETVAGGPEMAGKAKAIYIQRLKEFKWEGEEPSEEQKRQFAIAINILMDKGPVMAKEAMRNADPMVIRMLDGIMAGYSGQAASSEKYGWKGAVATTALGAAAGVAFFADNAIARGTMGALGGAAAGYRFGETRRLNKLEQEAEANITGRLIQADKWRKDLEKGLLRPVDTAAFCEEVTKFNRYLKGMSDTKDEENIVALLHDESRAVLRKQMENLVYESYRRGLFAHRAILDIQQRSDVTGKEAQIGMGDKFKKWLKKNGTRAGYTFGGAVAGAALAIAAGEGIKQLRELMGIGPGSLGRKLGIEQAPTDKGAFGGKAATAAEVAVAGAARGGAGAEAAATPEMTTAAETVQGSAVIGKGQGILHAANKIMHDQPDFFKGMNKQQIHDWKVHELQDMGFKFKNGKWGYPVTVHEGAKVNLVVGADGKPHLQLGAEHVTEHKYYKWEEANVKAKQAAAHEATHRRAAVRMETAAEMRGEEVPLPEQKLTEAQLKAGEEIYTRVEELPKAGAAGMTAEELAARHERGHKAFDELAAAKGKKATAMPQEEVVRRPREKAMAAEAPKAAAVEVPESVYKANVADLHKIWDTGYIDLYGEDDADVLQNLLRKLEDRMYADSDYQHRVDEIMHTGHQSQAQRMEAIVKEYGAGQLTPEEKLAVGHPFVDGEAEFVKLPIENPDNGQIIGTAFVSKGDESHAMRIEMEDGTVRFSSSSEINYTPEKAEEILQAAWKEAA